MSIHDSTQGALSLAHSLSAAGQLEQALKACQQGLVQDPSSAELNSFTADLCAKLGLQEEAIQHYRQSGILFLENGLFNQSISAYKNILNIESRDSAAHLALAAIYRTQGQANRAALAYELAAQALSADGKLRESLAVAQMIIDMSPDNVARRIRLADQYANADMIPESVREYSAALEFLHKAHRIPEADKIAARLRALKSQRGLVAAPSAFAAQGAQGAGGLRLESEQDRDGRGQSGRSPGSARSTPAEEDASVLVAEADSFLRLGLVDQAVDHLAAALVRNPLLRGLREPLVKLYLAQGNYKQAVAELWALITQGPHRQDEIRFLRYILRLDSHDPKVQQRLNALLEADDDDSLPDAQPDGRMAPLLSMGAVGSDLRAAVGSHRPRTDVATTVVMPAEDSPLYMSPGYAPAPSSRALQPSGEEEPGAQPTASAVHPAEDGSSAAPPASATTRPGLAQIEAIAEEIALSSRSFRGELEEIDRCVQQGRYDDALQRLQVLASCYPHNQTVRAQLAEIERAQRATADAPAAADEDSAREGEAQLPVSTEIAAALRSLSSEDPSPSQTTPTLTALLTGAKKPPLRTTFEVDLSDVQEVSPLRKASVAAPSAPPPPPRPMRPRTSRSPDAVAAILQAGQDLRQRGEVVAAIAEFEKVMDDTAQGTLASLLAGRCWRGKREWPKAIAAFMRGVNMPNATDAELSELFYDLGDTYAQIPDAKEALLFFQLAQGQAGYRDAAERIARLQEELHRAH
ncbi:MAG TPA: tetratricopeptide repeat protein [Pseudomonadota bacterium]|nr:tetratricopeptide repeat protein [Pseudomonadota bacterium]